MGKILLLGAGLVAGPLVRYLLGRGIGLTVASNSPARARQLLDGSPLGQAVDWAIDEQQVLARLVAQHEVVVSLLPAPLHPPVARACVAAHKHLVTTSYVSEQMAQLDGEARQADVLLLNEAGLDPGIDHMSAARIIRGVRQGGGHVLRFRSYCGGLPAPEANTNPWGYKFSWSPEGVLRAGTSRARYLKNGVEVRLSAGQPFLDVHQLRLPGEVGQLEAYPNRDSLGYIDLYDLRRADTVFRGTLRYPGWSRCMRALGELGLLSEEPGSVLDGAHSWPEALARAMGAPAADNIRQRVAAYLWLEPDAEVLDQLQWLGLFDARAPLPVGAGLLQRLARTMEHKLGYGAGERDMTVLHHDVIAQSPDGARQQLSASLVAFGRPGGASAMARTVSLPAAIAARLLLEGAVSQRGVAIPVAPELSDPILDELAQLGLVMTEQTTTL